MTKCEKEFEDAKQALSEVQTLYNRLKPELESRSTLSQEDELIWLAVKDRFSRASKRVYDARQTLLIERATTKRLSDSSGTAQSDIASRVENRIDSLLGALKPRNAANRKETRADDAQQRRIKGFRETIADVLGAGGGNADYTLNFFDELFSEKGLGHCEQFESKEDWEAFKLEHPIPSYEELALRTARGEDRILTREREIEQREAAKEAALLEQPSHVVNVIQKHALSDPSDKADASISEAEIDPEFDSLNALPPPYKAEKRVVLSDDAIERGRIANNSDDWRKSDANKNPNDSSRG